MRYLRYLAYGSNLHPRRMDRRIADLRIVETVALSGWSLKFHKIGRDGSGKCNLVEATGAAAYGVVYELSMQEQNKLDRIEGLGRGYEHHRLVLDRVGEVYFYRATDDHIDDGLRPYDWYKAFVVTGLEHHRAPRAYIEAVAAIPAAADPDPERVRINRAILQGS